MKLLSVLATSTLLSVGIATSSMAFSAPPAKTTQSQAAQAISIDQAINIAQRGEHGIVKSVDFDADDSEYEVELVSSNTKYEVKLDARNGKVIEKKQEKLSNNDVREYAPLQSAKTSLTQAMQTVSSSLKSQVVEAEFDTENGQPVYEIKVNKNGEEHKAYVDVNTGKILKTERD